MTITDLVEARIFKVRYLIAYRGNPGPLSEKVIVSPVANAPVDLSDYELPPELSAAIEWRSAHLPQNWILMSVVRHHRVVGYSFLHAPRQRAWLDSLPTNPGTARESGTYVLPAMRGGGVRQALLAAQLNFCGSHGLRMWSVIERSNAASLRSALKSYGRIWRQNYLLKAGGPNVVSLTTNPVRMYWLPGLRDGAADA